MKKTRLNLRGFTLIELLIVIGVLGIIAAVVFVALDPATRFADARDSRRWTDVSAIVDAIKVDQVDNGGTYISAVDGLTAGNVYMIGTAVTGCVPTDACDVTISGDTSCVSLAGLVTEGYIGSVPISPDNPDTTTDSWDATLTGYTITKAATGIITIKACDSENTTAISITR